MSTSTTSPRSVQLPSAAVLIATAYAICVLGPVAVFVGEIVFTDHDPHANDGPIDHWLPTMANARYSRNIRYVPSSQR